MKVEKKLKDQVTMDWQMALPSLTLYTKNKLYKIVGPVVIGLELVRLPRSEEYRPHFVMYPLWKKDIKTNLDFPILLKEYYDKKGFQYSIPYEKHSTFFADALESVKTNTPISFTGSISIKEIYHAIDNYAKQPPLSAAPNSYLQAALQASKLKIALFAGRTEAQEIFDQISRRNWDLNHFAAFGVDFNEWLQTLRNETNNRELFLEHIKFIKLEKKLLQMKHSDLIQ